MTDKKSVVTSFFKDISEKGLEQAIRNHGTADFSWWICGMGDVTGQVAQMSAAFTAIFDERGLVIEPLRMVSEGDVTVVEALTDSRLRSGEEYKNTITQWMTFSGSKIAKIAEYLDGAYSQQVIGPAIAKALAELH